MIGKRQADIGSFLPRLAVMGKVHTLASAVEPKPNPFTGELCSPSNHQRTSRNQRNKNIITPLRNPYKQRIPLARLSTCTGTSQSRVNPHSTPSPVASTTPTASPSSRTGGASRIQDQIQPYDHGHPRPEHPHYCLTTTIRIKSSQVQSR